MTDREMLEFAAKAAGVHPHDIECTWNSLVDDAQAMRLKVRLHLIVGSYATYSSVSGTYTPDGYEVTDETVVWHHETGGDARSAERLAITRCAAAIGAAMQASEAVG